MTTEIGVSVGMPVYNEEKYLRQALDSLLAQSFKNFEVIICDNLSTDSTPQICREYAEKDKRVFYYKNKKFVGACENYNNTFYLCSKKKYFMWASGNDMWHEDYIAECVKVLEERSDVVYCYSLGKRVDKNGNFLMDWFRYETSTVESPVFRLNSVLFSCTSAPVYGLARTDVLYKTGLMRIDLISNIIFLAEIALLGKVYQVDKPLFYIRYLGEQYGGDNTRRVISTYGRFVFFSRWRSLFKYFRVIGFFPMTRKQRFLVWMTNLPAFVCIYGLCLIEDIKKFFRVKLKIKKSPSYS